MSEQRDIRLREEGPDEPRPTIPPHETYPPHQETNGFAIASLVLGIVWVMGIGSILALVFGYIGKGEIDRSAGRQGGRGLAVAGIVLGWVGIGFILLFVLLSVIGVFNMGSFMDNMPRGPMGPGG